MDDHVTLKEIQEAMEHIDSTTRENITLLVNKIDVLVASIDRFVELQQKSVPAKMVVWMFVIIASTIGSIKAFQALPALIEKIPL